MATATATVVHHGFLHALGAPFRAYGRLMVYLMENNSRVQRVERLHAMSDAELAKLGLKREDIVHHVFRGMYGI